MIPIEFFLIFSSVLFAIGLFGIMSSRKGLLSLMCIEMMLNAANINFITFAGYFGENGDAVLGNVFVIFSIAIAAAEVAVGIAIMLKAYKQNNTNDLDDISSMRW